MIKSIMVALFLFVKYRSNLFDLMVYAKTLTSPNLLSSFGFGHILHQSGFENLDTNFWIRLFFLILKFQLVQMQSYRFKFEL